MCVAVPLLLLLLFLLLHYFFPVCLFTVCVRPKIQFTVWYSRRHYQSCISKWHISAGEVRRLTKQFQAIFNIFKWSPITCTSRATGIQNMSRAAHFLSSAEIKRRSSFYAIRWCIYANRSATNSCMNIQAHCVLYSAQFPWFCPPPDSARMKIYLRVFTIHAFLSYCHYLACKTIAQRGWEKTRERAHTIKSWIDSWFTYSPCILKQLTLSNKACLIIIAIYSSWRCIQFDNYCNKIFFNEFFPF